LWELRSTTTSGDSIISRPRDAGPVGIDPNLRGSFRIIPRPRESTAMVEPSLWTFAGRSQPCHGFAEPGGPRGHDDPPIRVRECTRGHVGVRTATPCRRFGTGEAPGSNPGPPGQARPKFPY
jgi:hypothetical protein